MEVATTKKLSLLAFSTWASTHLCKHSDCFAPKRGDQHQQGFCRDGDEVGCSGAAAHVSLHDSPTRICFTQTTWPSARLQLSQEALTQTPDGVDRHPVLGTAGRLRYGRVVDAQRICRNIDDPVTQTADQVRPEL
jgi:hypothetical protein